MQRVVDVKWSLDNRFVLSASDEMNLRIWKANASEKLGVVCISNITSILVESEWVYIPEGYVLCG